LSILFSRLYCMVFTVFVVCLDENSFAFVEQSDSSEFDLSQCVLS
jgi:hypothetical protein